jgi:hypothetical protein
VVGPTRIYDLFCELEGYGLVMMSRGYDQFLLLDRAGQVGGSVEHSERNDR